MLKSFLNLFKQPEKKEEVPPKKEPLTEKYTPVKIQPEDLEKIVVQQEKPKQPDLECFTFKIAGVTMKNENGEDIQNVIKKGSKKNLEQFGLKTFGGYTRKEIIEDDIEVFEFEDVSVYREQIRFEEDPNNPFDPNAIKIYIRFTEEDPEEKHVGYVPKTMTSQTKDLLANQDVRRITGNVTGGRSKEAHYDALEDKETVITKDKLSLGIGISIFYKQK